MLLQSDAVQGPLHIRYAGVVVHKDITVRDADDAGVFVVAPEPLPVGTHVELVGKDSTLPALVEGVVESATAGASGMRLRLMGELGAKVEIEGVSVALSADMPVLPSRVADVPESERTPTPAPVNAADAIKAPAKAVDPGKRGKRRRR
jgi:hypothetical protein